jgi:Holliday junction resolvase RusA-like endonuclease
VSFETCTFWVPGIPRPKGSLAPCPKRGARGLRRGKDMYYRVRDLVLLPQSEHLRAWTEAIQWGVLEHKPRHPLKGGFALTAVFYMPRPQEPRDRHHLTVPDVDKLLRAVLDALTGILWVDDSQVVIVETRKMYAKQKPGLEARIAYLSEQAELFT